MLSHTQLFGTKKILHFLFIIMFLLIYSKGYVCDLNVKSGFSYLDYHKYIVDRFNNGRQGWMTSVLGSELFKNTSVTPMNHNKRYVILVWKTSKRDSLQISSYKFDRCSVNNCIFVRNKIFINAADAVLVDLIYGYIPRTHRRNPKQRWVFLTTEPPTKTFFFAKLAPNISQLANVFNWSMTYRSDADVPIPFGRTLPLTYPKSSNVTYKHISELVPNWNKKGRKVLAVILMSCCGHRRRMEYLEKLKDHLRFNFYGKCSKKKHYCSSYGNDCTKLLSKYFFYLAFENSRCPQYLTEKIFSNGYSNGAIPVIHGASLEDCQKLLPPNSYLHTDNFETAEALANKIIEISQDDNKLLSYHLWRNDFDISVEHTRPHILCRICEAMNYNDAAPSVYTEDDLRLFLDPNILCKW